MKVRLVKEQDNEYDREAIQVKIKGIGKIGYVANSPFTIKGESMGLAGCMTKLEIKRREKLCLLLTVGLCAELLILVQMI